MPRSRLGVAAIFVAGALSVGWQAEASEPQRPLAPALEPGDTGPSEPLGHVTDVEVLDALLSTDPNLSCLPFVTGVAVSPHNALQIQIRPGYGASSFPTQGADFLLMSTGNPDAPEEFLDVDFAPPGCAGDNSQITLTFDFPDLGGGVSLVQSLKFDFDFFSYEFPEFVGMGFNDYVYAYLDAAPPAIPLDVTCNAPVSPPAGCLITFDGVGNPTNVDAAFFEACDTAGCDAPSGTPGWDDLFTTVPGDDAGRTGTLITCSPSDCTVPVTPGVHTLTFIVGDAGDGLFTSVGLFDNLRCFGDLQCEAPVTEPVCQSRLYGAAHSGGQTAASTLYEVDASSGAATTVGPIGFDAVGAMDFHPVTGALYGVGNRPADNEAVLIAIDTVSGAGTEVGPLANSLPGHMDLSFRNADAVLFLTAFSPSSPCISLFTVDPATGLATEVGDTTTCNPGNALGFDWSDTLQHLNNDGTLGGQGTRHVVDQALGTSAPVTALNYVGFPALVNPRPNAIDFDPSSGIGHVSVQDGNGGLGPNYVATLDPATGIVSHVGLTVNGLDALAWDPGCDDQDPCTLDVCEHCEAGETDCPCELFGTAHTGGPTAPSSLYKIDPASGTATPIGAVGFVSVGGIDFAPDGTLFGASSPLAGATLVTIDTTTGAGTAVGPTSMFAVSDLSFRNSDGMLFAFDPGGSLHTVDAGTGASLLVGASGIADTQGRGMTFDIPNTLWHAGNVETSTLDQGSASATPVAPLTFNGFPTPVTAFRINAMDAAPCSGTIWVSVADGTGGAGPSYLGTLDPVTGVVSFVGATVAGLDGVAARHKVKQGVCSHLPGPDGDGDGDCDAIDTCLAAPNPGGGPAPFGQTVLALSDATFGWAAAADYVVVRGGFVAPVDIRPYAFTFTVTGSGTSFNDATLPAAPGDGLWYLWAADCPAHSWTSGGAGECALGTGLPGCLPGERDGNLP